MKIVKEIHNGGYKMSFLDSYKRLEKLCGEMHGCEHGVTSYIDEMTNDSAGSRYVGGWDADLKELKHCRWIRNKIVHEPGCSEESMCNICDVQWLNHFYSRIMSANDPLAVYRRMKGSGNIRKPQQIHPADNNDRMKPANRVYKKSKAASGHEMYTIRAFIFSLLIILAVIAVFVVITALTDM